MGEAVSCQYSWYAIYQKLLALSSLSIVGTAKNTGKTATLNYVLQRIASQAPDKVVGLTSIGLEGGAARSSDADGEARDYTL